MTIDPNKFREYSTFKEQDFPDFCFREVPCPRGAPKGEVCYTAMPFGANVDQLDKKTKGQMAIKSNLDCPRLYVDMVNRCLYGRLSAREWCPKNLVNPYRRSDGEHGGLRV